MDIRIELLKDDVMKEVKKTTSYMGAKSEAANYDKYRTTEEDAEMLERFWVEALNIVSGLVKEYITAWETYQEEEVHGTTLEFNGLFATITMPSNWKDDGADIRGDVTSLIVNYIIGKWCEFVKPDEAEKYMGKIIPLGQGITDALYARKKPERKTPKK